MKSAASDKVRLLTFLAIFQYSTPFDFSITWESPKFKPKNKVCAFGRAFGRSWLLGRSRAAGVQTSLKFWEVEKSSENCYYIKLISRSFWVLFLDGLHFSWVHCGSLRDSQVSRWRGFALHWSSLLIKRFEKLVEFVACHMIGATFLTFGSFYSLTVPCELRLVPRTFSHMHHTVFWIDHR